MTDDELRAFAKDHLEMKCPEGLGEGILRLLAEIEELKDRVDYLENHGPGCECRECRIPYEV